MIDLDEARRVLAAMTPAKWCVYDQIAPYMTLSNNGGVVVFSSLVNIDHAAYLAYSGSRLQPCPACVNAVVKALEGKP
jgi:hypothetical protein